MTFTGTTGAINTALAGMTFTPPPAYFGQPGAGVPSLCQTYSIPSLPRAAISNPGKAGSRFAIAGAPLNRMFIDYQKHFGEALKLGKQILEGLKGK